MNAVDRITIASRVFCIALVCGLGLLSRDVLTLLSLALVALVATTAIYVSLATPLATVLVVTVEAAVTGFIIALGLPGSVVFLPYLVVLTLIAGIAKGLVGVSAVVLTQFFAIGLITLAASAASLVEVFELLSPWLITSIGAGLLGSWLFHAAGVVADQDDASYESAHRLLTQLRIVSRRLSFGLDHVRMASQILRSVKQHTNSDAAVVFIRTDSGIFSPLAHSHPGVTDDLTFDHPVANQCWLEMAPAFASTGKPSQSQTAAFPLQVGSRMIGVVLAKLPSRPPGPRIDELLRELRDHSMRLDTALTFDEVRTIATVEERRRLAREIHDGIAQEIASLGYLVDNLIGDAGTSRQREELVSLRYELSRIVSELRLSIFDLRSEVLAETGLGAALSEYVRQVGARTNMTVHVILDEAPTRLRAESETHLLRIAQEAITNARKHSRAKNLWVLCRVIPPFAELEIRDDGIGPREGGLDAYGLRIMKERAQRANGSFEIMPASNTSETPGTIVRVTIGAVPNPRAGDE